MDEERLSLRRGFTANPTPGKSPNIQDDLSGQIIILVPCWSGSTWLPTNDDARLNLANGEGLTCSPAAS